jgi:hypothetical protein
MTMLISSGPAFFSGVGDAGHQPRGAQVDVLIQLEAHFEEDFGFENALRNLADPRGSTPTAPKRMASWAASSFRAESGRVWPVFR